MPGPIVLLTDFGLADAYVGIMKGVILRIAPRATIVDLCHQVAPQGIAEGAFLLATSYRFFDPSSIFVAVVDPGVGSARRPIALRTPHGTFVGPDNGLFGPIAEAFGARATAEVGRLCLKGSRAEGVSLTNDRYFLPEVSATFHGRDVFAPVGARLFLGVPLAALGPGLADLIALPIAGPERRDGELIGHVVHVDRFGNLITDLTGADLRQLARPVLRIAGQRIAGISHHYAERAGLLALIGSSGHLEIAQAGGSAAAALGLGVAAEVIVREEERV
ncbi:MAG: SAM hydrolase/SAM-dependent halogenase family protein [Chloroflexota bacterium]